MTDNARSSSLGIKCLQVDRLGDPSKPDLQTLRIVHRKPIRPLPPNFVRIRVTAASINYADALQIQGKYQEKLRLPFTPGSEVSGVITEVGRDVRSGLKVNDTVCAVTNGGAFAEEAIAPALNTIKIPSSSDVEAAAGLPVAFGTAYMALKQRANVRHGHTVLVLGAAGGVGLAAVQLAKLFGAKVIAVAHGRTKMEALETAGADICIDMEAIKIDNLRETIKNAAPQGIDVLFDPVGGALANEAFKCMKWNGQILIIGFASNSLPSFPANISLVKNITIHGIYWGSHAQHNPAEFRKSLEAVADFFAAGDITVFVSHKYSLEQAREAFSVMMNRHVVGKLVLCPQPKSML